MKERMSEELMAMRAAKELRDGDYCNLGLGIPQLCASYVLDTVKVQTENGALGYGPLLEIADTSDVTLENIDQIMEQIAILVEQRNPFMSDAGSRYFSPAPGMSFFDLLTSFAMIRSGRLTTILGGLQVAENGDLANHSLGTAGEYPHIGGAMDLAWGANRVIVTMTHTTTDDKPKVLKKLTMPLTCSRSVDLLITNLAVIEVTPDGFLLRETAPDWTVEEIQALTEARLQIADDVKEVEL